MLESDLIEEHKNVFQNLHQRVILLEKYNHNFDFLKRKTDLVFIDSQEAHSTCLQSGFVSDKMTIPVTWLVHISPVRLVQSLVLLTSLRKRAENSN